MHSSNGMTVTRQMRLVGLLLIAAIATLGLAWFLLMRPGMTILAGGLQPTEAATLVEALRGKHIDYELRDGGTTIMVPEGQADELRLDLAGSDLPLKGTVGFELFNESDMGLTDFAQKVNYQRALQGELARTIMAMDGIASARVHLALPERSLFRANRSAPRAAVSVTTLAGSSLDAARVAGIQRLVAAAVPDLAFDEVAVLDARGQLVSPVPIASFDPSGAQFSNALERSLGQRIGRVIRTTYPSLYFDVKVVVVAQSGFGDPGTAAERQSNHAIRAVIFTPTPLEPDQQQVLRATIIDELSLRPSRGDELRFSLFPQASAPMSVVSDPQPVSPVTPAAAAESPAMPSWAWQALLVMLSAGALGWLAMRHRRSRLNRREQLVVRLREHLRLIDGVIDVPA